MQSGKIVDVQASDNDTKIVVSGLKKVRDSSAKLAKFTFHVSTDITSRAAMPGMSIRFHESQAYVDLSDDLSRKGHPMRITSTIRTTTA